MIFQHNYPHCVNKIFRNVDNLYQSSTLFWSTTSEAIFDCAQEKMGYKLTGIVD